MNRAQAQVIAEVRYKIDLWEFDARALREVLFSLTTLVEDALGGYPVKDDHEPDPS